MKKMRRKTKTLTSEEIKKLELMGVKVRVPYKNKCILCGKKFTSKNKERLAKRLEKHVNEACEAAKWVHTATRVLEIADLTNVIMADLYYLQEGKFSKGYERTKPEELEILNDVKNALDNWSKEDGNEDI